jgi:hypothetical protein
MPLDEDNEFVLIVDSVRSVSLIPTTDGASVCLSVEDPHVVAVVELTRLEVDELIEALEPYRRKDEDG